VPRPQRYALAVELTSHCNQRCSYCYNDWREDNGRHVGALATHDLTTLLARALREVEFDHVTLTGGEPFTRPDIFQILDVCREAGVGIQIISNGGIMSHVTAERLAPYAIRAIQITLNGPNATLHDELVGGRHFDATVSGIQALTQHGVRVAGCIVVTRKNAAFVDETLALMWSLGVRLVALSRFSPAGFSARNVAELLPARSDILQALAQAEPWGARGMDLQVTMPVPPCVIDYADFPHVTFGACPIGTSAQEFALGPRGELRSCTLHTEVIGDARTQSFADLVEAPSVTAYRDVTPEFCAPCPERERCLGGCGAAAATTMGDPRGLDPFVAQHVDPAFAEALQRKRSHRHLAVVS